jgi:hypothetical protein
MTNSDLSEMYNDWLAEQNEITALKFEAQQEVLKEFNECAEKPTPLDWSTWCQALCS